MKYPEIKFGQMEAIINKLGGEEGVLKFLRGELVVQPAVVPEPISEPAPDFIVRVDRSVKPSYPDWMKKLMYPDLELTGPAEYDIQKLGLWLHDDQKDGVVSGNTIYTKLEKDNALADCLGLADLLAIKAKVIIAPVFLKLFAGKIVFGWKSVAQRQNGDLVAPYLIVHNGRIMVLWYWLNSNWNSNHLALRFSK